MPGALVQLCVVNPMVTAPLPVDGIRDAVRALCESNGVARMDLFGSVARGEGRKGSDVDLLVEFLPETRAGLFEMGALKEDLEETLGCRLDLVSRGAVEKSRNPIRRQARYDPRCSRCSTRETVEIQILI